MVTPIRRLSVMVAGSVLGLALSALSVQAITYSCKFDGCPFQATCDGDFWEHEGPCAIQCWVFGPNPGQIEEAGSATCGNPV